MRLLSVPNEVMAIDFLVGWYEFEKVIDSCVVDSSITLDHDTHLHGVSASVKLVIVIGHLAIVGI